ncbi:DNA-formamidopyrimidine glycosylase [Deinococcus sp. Marseille-Q6407]|uniref:DNA-formamidopyrimidine glycosylase n=1 Tax=Deinococcus sp. Marseille-Q6407 TaxID=2969223 RepID=UPI0021C1056F|nr:DNA-formamidopyrimidine glycosylase [Deinococcus sp. Marseille-Q6407]
MPELPEVETTRRTIAPIVTGRTVLEIQHRHPEKYPDTELAHGRTILEPRRRGKYLILPLSDAGAEPDRELIVHLGMTGGFRLEETPHTRLTLLLDSGPLYFNDPRRFGKVRVVPAGEYAALPTLAAMGPEPLSDDFRLDAFTEAAARAGAVKPWLLSQRPVAGVGNIYADEALWRARIHPSQQRLSAEQAQRLHGAIREVLGEAVDAGGSSLGNGVSNYRQLGGEWGGFQVQHAAYGRGGQPCPRCGTPLEKTVLGQRGTHFCPQCQQLTAGSQHSPES